MSERWGVHSGCVKRFLDERFVDRNHVSDLRLYYRRVSTWA